MASLGRLPLSTKFRVLEGISSLKCPLFSHSYLPMNSSHSSLQTDWIGEAGGSSLWSCCVYIGGQDTDNRLHHTWCSLLFFHLRLLPTNVPLSLIGNSFSMWETINTSLISAMLRLYLHIPVRTQNFIKLAQFLKQIICVNQKVKCIMYNYSDTNCVIFAK